MVVQIFSGVTETPIIKIYTLIGVLIVRQFIFELDNSVIKRSQYLSKNRTDNLKLFHSKINWLKYKKGDKSQEN